MGEWPWYRDSVTVMRYQGHSVAAQPGRMNITADTAIKPLPILQGRDAPLTGSRDLRVDAEAPRKLEILSARGKALQHLEGIGRQSYRPVAFAKGCVRWVR